ncbi:MAG: Gfo/Idh/MocA family protein [Rhodospirillales bacterium]
MNRRYFLMGTAAATGSLRASALQSANDTVRVACVGVRGQGRSHIQTYARMPNVEIAALCDIDENVLNQNLQLAEKLTKKRPAAYVDLRKLLEDKSIDAVSIATPNHSHTLQAIWAMQAGKDVYIEKPCSHNMFECKQIVAARKKYNRIVQHGTNSRSGVAVQEAVRQMREGLIGEVYLARGICFKWRDTIGRAPVEPVPAGVNYDLWLGPAPVRPFTKNRFHYNWHWFWDYGNGDMGNQGIHEMDNARWGLGVTYPTKVTAIGGHFMFDDDQETPNTITALFEFNGTGGKKKMLEFTVRHWISNHEAGINDAPGRKDRNTIGNIWYGSKGYVVVEGYNKYYSFLGPDQEPGPSLAQGGNNWANFIQAVRSRKYEDLNAPIEEGAISCTLVHLANISYRLGRSIRFDADTYTCPGDSEATKMFTRQYRKPFVVPEKV